MPVQKEVYQSLLHELGKATLVAVSKTKPVEDIQALYKEGQRDFGENYVQELTAKQPLLPGDIRWHFIGHLQSNKVKYIAPVVYMIHGVDSLKLLMEINRQGVKNSRKIKVLLQLHIAEEETKFGLSEDELQVLLQRLTEAEPLENIEICGLMAMASFSGNPHQIRLELSRAHSIFEKNKATHFANQPSFNVLSMGMSGDYKIALEEGSTLVRIGSMLFGERG